VGTVSRLRAERLRNSGSIPGKGERLLYSPPSLLLNGYWRDLPPGVKWMVRGAQS
jgi:hypothetical protein